MWTNEEMAMFRRTLGCSIFFEAVAWTYTDLIVAEAQHFGFFGYQIDSVCRELDKMSVAREFHFYNLFKTWCVYPMVDKISDTVILGDILVAVSMLKRRDF